MKYELDIFSWGEFKTFTQEDKEKVFNEIYAILLFAIYPLKPLQLFYNGIKNRKKWATQEIYNKHFGGKDDNARTY